MDGVAWQQFKFLLILLRLLKTWAEICGLPHYVFPHYTTFGWLPCCWAATSGGDDGLNEVKKTREDNFNPITQRSLKKRLNITNKEWYRTRYWTMYFIVKLQWLLLRGTYNVSALSFLGFIYNFKKNLINKF